MGGELTAEELAQLEADMVVSEPIHVSSFTLRKLIRAARELEGVRADQRNLRLMLRVPHGDEEKSTGEILDESERFFAEQKEKYGIDEALASAVDHYDSAMMNWNIMLDERDRLEARIAALEAEMVRVTVADNIDDVIRRVFPAEYRHQAHGIAKLVAERCSDMCDDRCQSVAGLGRLSEYSRGLHNQAADLRDEIRAAFGLDSTHPTPARLLGGSK